MAIRNKLFFTFFCSWLFINTAICQDFVQTVRGRVIDAESHAGLPGATVAITTLNPVAGTATDIDGYFRFEKIAVGRHDIKVNYLGYKEQFLSQVLVGSGKEIVLEIMLEESVKKLDEVVIKSREEGNEAVNEMATVSSRSFSVEQTGKFAASGDDPARLAMSFAGVATQDDLFNEIVIRGNSPRGLLWKLEGVEIPNPNHLSQEGGNGGAVSMLSNNVLGASDFYTSAFPAEYGNASSGVFDLHMKKGNNEKREYAVQLGTLGLEAAVEGPFVKGKKSSYLINYRYSTLAVIEATGYKITGDIRIGFQDINYNFFFPTKKQGTFTVFGVGGLSWSKLDD
ncbi:MAG: carboxypeptidase-like regulatory domain-containing protein, partial [Bacteroidia bacterium]